MALGAIREAIVNLASLIDAQAELMTQLMTITTHTAGTIDEVKQTMGVDDGLPESAQHD